MYYAVRTLLFDTINNTYLSSSSARLLGGSLLGNTPRLLGGRSGRRGRLATGTGRLGALDGGLGVDGLEDAGPGVASLGAGAFANHDDGRVF